MKVATQDIYRPKLDEASRRAALLPARATYILPDLFGAEWADVIAGCNPNTLGRRYSEAVESRRIAHSRYHSVDRSPRYSRYVRVDIENEEK